MDCDEPGVTSVASLTGAMSCAAAFGVIVQDCTTEIDTQLALFLNTDAESGPHKARVALRRLTTALDAFAPILRRRAALAVRAEAKRIFRALGRVRDADVYLAGEGGAGAAPRLRRETAALRVEIRQKLRARKAVAFAPRLMRDLAAGDLVRRGPVGQAAAMAPLSSLARAALDRAWARVGAAGGDLAALKIEALHDFRKDMKTLRYLAEFFAPLWPESQLGTFRRHLQDLQDDLGELTDMAMAEGRGRKPDPARRATILSRAGVDWRKLASRPPFWRNDAGAE